MKIFNRLRLMIYRGLHPHEARLSEFLNCLSIQSDPSFVVGEIYIDGFGYERFKMGKGKHYSESQIIDYVLRFFKSNQNPYYDRFFNIGLSKGFLTTGVPMQRERKDPDFRYMPERVENADHLFIKGDHISPHRQMLSLGDIHIVRCSTNEFVACFQRYSTIVDIGNAKFEKR